jgi:hypothetical protein
VCGDGNVRLHIYPSDGCVPTVFRTVIEPPRAEAVIGPIEAETPIVVILHACPPAPHGYPTHIPGIPYPQKSTGPLGALGICTHAPRLAHGSQVGVCGEGAAKIVIFLSVLGITDHVWTIEEMLSKIGQ